MTTTPTVKQNPTSTIVRYTVAIYANTINELRYSINARIGNYVDEQEAAGLVADSVHEIVMPPGHDDWHRFCALVTYNVWHEDGAA